MDDVKWDRESTRERAEKITCKSKCAIYNWHRSKTIGPSIVWVLGSVDDIEEKFNNTLTLNQFYINSSHHYLCILNYILDSLDIDLNGSIIFI